MLVAHVAVIAPSRPKEALHGNTSAKKCKWYKGIKEHLAKVVKVLAKTTSASAGKHHWNAYSAAQAPQRTTGQQDAE
jgi:hypothetical protein